MPEFNSLAAHNIMPIPDLNEIPNEGRNLDAKEEAWIYDDRNIKPIENRTQKLKHDEPDPYNNLVAGIPTSGDALGMNLRVVETTTKPLPSWRPKREPSVEVLSVPLQKRPEWLPCGWWIDHKIRSSGSSAGNIDKYYFEPASGRKFRSRKEVEYFLQTGSKRKKTANPDADAHSQEKSGSKKKRSAPLNFDFNDVPESVRWVMTDAVKDQWTPFIGDQIVPKSVRQEWNSAYHFSCS